MNAWTVPGYINRNGQKILREANSPGNYRLYCGNCTAEYDANEAEIAGHF